MLSLATFAIPTGVRAWVEDVVVDAGTRGMGAGQQLVEAAVAHAQKIGARTVDLTSRPSREAANRLYRRCGFEHARNQRLPLRQQLIDIGCHARHAVTTGRFAQAIHRVFHGGSRIGAS